MVAAVKAGGPPAAAAAEQAASSHHTRLQRLVLGWDYLQILGAAQVRSP